MLCAALPIGSALAISVVVGYLLGSVPVAVLVGRSAGVDLRTVGDRNPGYWNAKQQLPRRASRLIFAGDAAKGVLAGAVGQVLAGGGRWWMAYLAVGAAMIGHAFPLFAGFRGGRSILTFAGGAFVLSPRAALAALALSVVVSLAARAFAWGARAGVFGFPVLQAVVAPRARVAATGCLMGIIGVRFAMAAVTERRARVAERLGRSPGSADVDGEPPHTSGRARS